MFANRRDGGRRLAEQLSHLRDHPDVVIVGLPRGGVPVAAEVAEALEAPLDVIVVRKLGVPFQPELGMGAIGEAGIRVVNDDIVRQAHVNDEELAAVEARERVELERRAHRFRQGRSRISLANRIVVIVDDGIATGSTAKAACNVARAEGAERVILAVPVAPADWITRLAGAADEFVALDTPVVFRAVGQFYQDFSQTSDEQVVDLLDRAAARMSATARAGVNNDDDPPARDEDVNIEVGPVVTAGELTVPAVQPVVVSGHLTVPQTSRGLVIFAHGSGSSRHSPRNRYVASVLNGAGLATLLFDLLTDDEELDRANVFDIGLLARRLADVTTWTRRQPELDGLAVGYFGASTGAAAALWAAADLDDVVAAVVSRGGRPDLAGSRLRWLDAPTLLIVGGHDTVVLEMNRQAQAQLRCENELSVVPGATHLFEEPGALQAVAELAREWFVRHLGGSIDPP